MDVKRCKHSNFNLRHNDFPKFPANGNPPKLKGEGFTEAGDIRDAETDNALNNKKKLHSTKAKADPSWAQLWNKKMDNRLMKELPPTDKNHTYANNLREAANKTKTQFKPIIRGDEAAQDAKIRDQESFGRAVDQVAKEYGLDPNMFRAQLQKESGAFTQGYKKAMRHEGDLSRASENNTSIGLGQISRKFLDGREWSDGGPNNRRVGGKAVTTDQYNNSAITQLRVAAANSAMRIADHGGLEQGLLYYVSGRTTRDAQNGRYLDGINEYMRDKKMMNIGR